MAAERLGELRGLAVPHAVRYLPHRERLGGQHLGCPVHAHARQVVAERGVSDLGVGPLELAA